MSTEVAHAKSQERWQESWGILLGSYAGSLSEQGWAEKQERFPGFLGREYHSLALKKDSVFQLQDKGHKAQKKPKA